MAVRSGPCRIRRVVDPERVVEERNADQRTDSAEWTGGHPLEDCPVKHLLISAAGVSSLALGGCATNPHTDYAVKATAVGAAIGAGAGAFAGSVIPGIGTGAGAAVGAGVGGLIGSVIGTQA